MLLARDLVCDLNYINKIIEDIESLEQILTDIN